MRRLKKVEKHIVAITDVDRYDFYDCTVHGLSSIREEGVRKCWHSKCTGVFGKFVITDEERLKIRKELGYE